MATAPIVSFTKKDLTPLSRWDIGVVDTGSASADLQLLIWNNKGGTTAVSDMESVTITTKDSLGGDTGDLVTGQWIKAKCVSMNETNFVGIGGATTKAIKASGATVSSGVIKGTANDGTYENAKDNFSELVLRAEVPSITTTSGNVDFYVRVAFSFQ